MKKHYGALLGFLSSLILLTLIIIVYYTTVTITLLGPQLSLIFKALSILYSWPFLMIASVFNFFKIDIFNAFALILISSGTYTIIGHYIFPHIKKIKSHKK